MSVASGASSTRWWVMACTQILQCSKSDLRRWRKEGPSMDKRGRRHEGGNGEIHYMLGRGI